LCISATATYLFVCQVDGNGWSSQFKELMMTSALTFKSSIYPEWYDTSSLISSLRFASLPKLKYLQSPQVHWLPCPLGPLRPNPTCLLRPIRRPRVLPRWSCGSRGAWGVSGENREGGGGVEFDILEEGGRRMQLLFCLGAFAFYAVVVVGPGRFSCPYQYVSLVKCWLCISGWCLENARVMSEDRNECNFGLEDDRRLCSGGFLPTWLELGRHRLARVLHGPDYLVYQNKLYHSV